MAVNSDGMIESGIFESLQRKIDDDSAVKDVRRGDITLFDPFAHHYFIGSP